MQFDSFFHPLWETVSASQKADLPINLTEDIFRENIFFVYSFKFHCWNNMNEELFQISGVFLSWKQSNKLAKLVIMSDQFCMLSGHIGKSIEKNKVSL